MALNKLESSAINLILGVVVALFSGWLIIEKFIIGGILFCFGGILSIYWFHTYRTKDKPLKSLKFFTYLYLIIFLLIIHRGKLFNKKQIQTNNNKKNQPSSIFLDENQPHLNQKEISNITPSEILNAIKNTDSPLAADNLVKTLYRGKYVKWTGETNTILNSDGHVDIFWEHGLTIFDYSKVPLSLKCGMVVTIIGRIKSVFVQNLIILDECALVKIH